MRLLLIDNYDSFTYNLVHYLAELGVNIDVIRNDAITVEQIAEHNPNGIIISPGPCTPNEAGICLDLINKLGTKIPMLGVCLGHQSIAQSFGGKVIQADTPMHGKTSVIQNTGQGVFKGLPNNFTVTRYHSLIVERPTLPDCFDITAQTDDNIIMAVQHKQHNLHGVQFHPESIASEYGHDILRNFVELLN